MCPPPCGPRRRSTVDHVKSERITKSEVEEIITSGDFVCFYRMGDEIENQEYEGCLHNLLMILHDRETRVRVVGSRSKDYAAGRRTVVMTAPCFPATFILRIED
jgi:hypothetical protein